MVWMLFMMDAEVPTLFQTLQAPGKVAGCLLLGLSRREFVRRPGVGMGEWAPYRVKWGRMKKYYHILGDEHIISTYWPWCSPGHRGKPRLWKPKVSSVPGTKEVTAWAPLSVSPRLCPGAVSARLGAGMVLAFAAISWSALAIAMPPLCCTNTGKAWSWYPGTLVVTGLVIKHVLSTQISRWSVKLVVPGFEPSMFENMEPTIGWIPWIAWIIRGSVRMVADFGFGHTWLLLILLGVAASPLMPTTMQLLSAYVPVPWHTWQAAAAARASWVDESTITGG